MPSAAQEPDTWAYVPSGELVIRHRLYIWKKSQYPIVLGHRGAKLRTLVQATEAALTESFGCPVTMQLHVQQREAER